jgi:hypothetical protein
MAPFACKPSVEHTADEKFNLVCVVQANDIFIIRALRIGLLCYSNKVTRFVYFTLEAQQQSCFGSQK